MIEVYRGSANMWECDEMGHMNVRFYVARMMEGLMEFAHVADLPSAFSGASASILTPRDQHVRYLNEARPGQPLVMTAGVLDTTDSSVLIYQQFDHTDGRPCATYRTWVDHLELDTRIPFAWSSRTREAFERHAAEAPHETGPRSIDFDAAPAATATTDDADACGALTIGRGVVQAQHCDLYGFMLPEMFVARVSDSISHLLSGWREAVADEARAKGDVVRTGGAVLENRWVFRRWPRAGDRIVVRSALADVAEKTHAFHHWLVDPASGRVWATNRTSAITFNLDTRKVIATSQQQRDQLKALVPAGLFI